VALSASTRLGPYEIVAPLGAGGMGEVYRARDTRLGREVALKVVPADLSSDPERVQRFEHEARAAAALNHPNILALYDIGSYESSPYLVSELLEGATLRERLRGGSLPVRKAVAYGVQIARGLAAAHEKGIIHRDLKPENVFVTADGHVKILDFGLAKLTEREPAFSSVTNVPTALPITNPGVIIGTLGYMSPEQVRGVSADARSDIFAFGTILYEMLSGRSAFRGETSMDSLTAILRDDPRDLPASERHIPPALVRIVERCLEKSPSARFQTSSDLAFALDALSAGSGATEAVTAISGRDRRLRFGPIVAATIGVLAVAALVSSAVVYFRSAPIDARVYRSTFVPPGNLFGLPFGRLALSPDGRRLAFVAAGSSGSRMLWIRPLDSLSAQPVPGTEGALAPFWSPDSRFIAFTADGKLKKIDPAGGPAVPLCDNSSPVPGSWSRDNVIVFGPSGNGRGPLLRVAAAGGVPTPVTTLDSASGETVHGFPFFLPDGRHFIHVAGTANPLDASVYVSSLESKGRTRLAVSGNNPQYAQGHLLFIRGTTLVAQSFDAKTLVLSGEAAPVAAQIDTFQGLPLGAFSVSENGVLAYQQSGNPQGESRFIWFDRAGKPLGALGARGRYGGEVSLSPDGRHAAVAAADPGPEQDIWVFDVARGFRTRFTVDPGSSRTPIWTPDGTRIVFAARRNGRPLALYERDAEGAGGEQLLLSLSDRDAVAQSVSPDGRLLMYTTLQGNDLRSTDIWVLPLAEDRPSTSSGSPKPVEGRKPFPFATSPFSELGGQFSPDGRWVAYESDESGRPEVYVVRFPTGGKTQVSSAGGHEPRWRADGKELYYRNNSNTLMAAAVRGDGARFEVGAVQPLFDIHPTSFPGGYAVSRDGRFLVSTVEQQTTIVPITFVINWPGALHKDGR